MAGGGRAAPRRRRAPAVLWLTGLAWLACAEEQPAATPSSPEASAAQPVAAEPGPLSREEVLGPFLASHWRFPIAHQGDPPASFSEAEASLDPAACGACHPQQFAEWRSSLHAGAFSPGFAGQLIEGSLAQPASLRHCQTCHTPLAEQQPVTAAGEVEPAYDPGLRAAGLVCAGCHVRAHRRHGPPRRPELPPLTGDVPHAGFEARPEYQESRFCAPCHQFFDDAGVNGKPLENTFAEWRASPHAARGETCQSCHMPERAHLWRGIHDAEMVRGGVEIRFELEPTADASQVRASLRLRNTGVGHAFPTYVTPRVVLSVAQLDGAGSEIPGTRGESVIARKIDFGSSPWREISDTRVLPGGTALHAYAEPRASMAVTLEGRVSVDPDFHYRGVFASLLQSYRDPRALELIGEAHQRAANSSYVLETIRRPLVPPASAAP